MAAAIARVRKKLRQIAAPAEENPLAVPRENKSQYVLQAMQDIAEHYANPEISITSIATALSVSEGHLSHIFKKETGSTVLGYLTRYRIHRAEELLKDRKKKVYEVAAAVGYSDVTYFSSTFKKYTGMSPSEFQSNCI